MGIAKTNDWIRIGILFTIGICIGYLDFSLIIPAFLTVLALYVITMYLVGRFYVPKEKEFGATKPR